MTNHIRRDPILLLASLLLITGFFLPWIDVQLWGIIKVAGSRGYELPALINDLFEEEYPPGLLYSVFGIPLAGALTLYAEFRRVKWLRLVAPILAVALVILWSILIWQLTGRVERRLPLVTISPFKILQTGFYLTVIGAVACIFCLRRR